ncbi:hypothetical protein [Turicibacter sanguinis]|uniref:hypothetical protein n=1 Tax=Turicibacter sanguinis TaxID=154288 RepID=UPI0018A93489|nr:hypothetical protein [Turicibacter sanguinis]MDB8553512.1 hypothetical protein [Turicibacter sanguinis]
MDKIKLGLVILIITTLFAVFGEWVSFDFMYPADIYNPEECYETNRTWSDVYVCTGLLLLDGTYIIEQLPTE